MIQRAIVGPLVTGGATVGQVATAIAGLGDPLEGKKSWRTVNAQLLGFETAMTTLNRAVSQSTLIQPDAINAIHDNMTKVAAVVSDVVKIDKKATKYFNGGKIQVMHNLRFANFKIDVRMSAAQLARGVANVDFPGTSKGLVSAASGAPGLVGGLTRGG